MIPHMQESPLAKYTQAILPYGSQLYTGVLQAAGYLLLKTHPKICFIDIQEQQEELILQKTGTFGPVFGQKHDIQLLDENLPQSNQRTKKNIEICLWQLWFNALIQGKQDIHRISIRASFSPQEKKTICEYFKKKENINYIRLANLASKNQNSDLKDISDWKKKSNNKDHKIFQLFAWINKKQHIIAYTEGFTCIVG